MSILIMSRRVSTHDVWLQDLNEDLLMLTGAKLAAESNNYHYTESFDNYERNSSVEIRVLELYEKHQFRAILAMSEFDMLRAARLREVLGIQGQSVESALAFRDKTVMKGYLKQAGLKVPDFAKLDSSIDLYQFVKQHGYPVIVKPVDGIGSMNTAVLRNRDDLLAYLSDGLKSNLEVETFIEGKMYHIDGLVIGGNVVHCWPSSYTTGCLGFQEGNLNGSYMLGEDNPLTQRLIEYTMRVLKALPTLENASFHAEVFHTPGDELIFCEIASRTGGRFIRDMIQVGFGFDINKEVALAQSGIGSQATGFSTGEKGPQKASGFLMIPVKKGILRKFPTEQFPDWVIKHQISGKLNQEYSGPTSSVDVIGTFLVEGDSEEQVLSRLQELGDWLERSTEWELV